MYNIKTLVIGASSNPLRYSYKAVRSLLNHGMEVEAIGKRPAQIDSVSVKTEKEQLDNIHTVTLYVSPDNQKDYIDYIISLQPKRIIFNPGTHNASLEQKAKKKGIEVVHDCTLIMLNENKY